ncbi:uncharacterized protein [Palaemon carinicauda]|uniref:uncharacterized protein n=1 Tax=Palaemon carinicauda TaxID=392227 RepID=UPI0035B59072
MKKFLYWTKATTLVLVVGLASARDPGEHLNKCVKIAEPLVRDPKYNFPIDIQDIREVCRMWETFLECVYAYANTFMASPQKRDFNKTLHSSIEGIQQLCSEDPEYQKLYMAYAPCMKRVSMEPSHCGNQYRHLTDLVQIRSISDGQLCCGHRKFRECVLETTAEECDGGGILLGAGRSPSQFMKKMLDQTMGFMLQKCRDFVPNPRDCPNTTLAGVVSAGNSEANQGIADDLIMNLNNLSPDSSAASTSPSQKPPATPPPPPSPPPPSSTTYPTTRFTWTTRRSSGTNSPSTPRPTSSINLAGNSLLGPASQQFKDSGIKLSPNLAAVGLTVGVLLRM